VWRRAVSLADGRSESPPETLLRLLHVLGGIPVEPQRTFHDVDGRFVGRADLWLVGTKRIHEIDGLHHRTAEQHGKDLARDKRCARAGIERYGYTSRELLTQPGRILADAEMAAGLAPDGTRLRRWMEELKLSTYTASGRQRLLTRWRPTS
jgi:very-short-patch-repair endonuclease